MATKHIHFNNKKEFIVYCDIHHEFFMSIFHAVKKSFPMNDFFSRMLWSFRCYEAGNAPDCYATDEVLSFSWIDTPEGEDYWLEVDFGNTNTPYPFWSKPEEEDDDFWWEIDDPYQRELACNSKQTDSISDIKDKRIRILSSHIAEIMAMAEITGMCDVVERCIDELSKLK